MIIAQGLYDRIVAHARAEAPNECCGIVGTRGGRAVEVYPAENSAHSPLRYELASDEQLAIMRALDERELELGAIYHSHTRSAPFPSQTDINLARYPDALYIIVGLAQPEAPEVRAFSIRDRVVTEQLLQVAQRDGLGGNSARRGER